MLLYGAYVSAFECGMCCSKACDRHAIRRAACKVEADLVAECDGVRVAAMFTTDTCYEVRASCATACGGDLHEFADAFPVEYGVRIFFEDLFSEVVAEEFTFGIVTAEAEASLRKVVGAEAEEFCVFGEFIGEECGTRHFDHGTYAVMEFRTRFFHDFCSDAVDARFEECHFFCADGERNFDFRKRRESFFRKASSRLTDGTHLHFVYFGIRDTKTAATMTEHRVCFVEFFDLFQKFLCFGKASRVCTECF